MKKLTPEFYDMCIAEIGSSIDEKRWLLAKLAAQARDDGILDWAERMANHPKICRSRSTIYEWVAVMDFRNSLNKTYNLLFSHYAAVARKSNAIGIEKAEEILELAEAEGMTVETVQAFVSTLVKPLPPPFSLADWLSDEYLRACDAIDAAQADLDIEALQRVRDALGEEQSRLVPVR